MQQIVQRQFFALNCCNEIILAVDSAADTTIAEAAIAKAIAHVEASEARLSRFRPDSELCRLNQYQGKWFTASTDLFAIIAKALAWAERTEGLFTPTILPALEAEGYNKSFEQFAHASVQNTPQSLPEGEQFRGNLHSDIQLDATNQRILLPFGVRLDLGGIGKGWIAHQLCMSVLADFPHVLVNIGGDLAVRGGISKDAGWVIGIRDPRTDDADIPSYLGGFTLRDSSVATSGAAWRWWIRGGIVRHHLIDPRTNRSATTVAVTGDPKAVLSVTVVAKNAVAAEALAKYALLLGESSGLQMLSQREDATGVFAYGDGHLTVATNMTAYLASQKV